jgi:hypothetical protein
MGGSGLLSSVISGTEAAPWSPSKVKTRIRRWPRRGRVVGDGEMLAGRGEGENRRCVVDL